MSSSKPRARPTEPDEAKNPFLVALGERVKSLRSRRGMTRRATAVAAGVSERHLANLEYGIGNASILVLQQVALALHCPIAELVGDQTTSSPEWLMLRSLLEGRDEPTVREVRQAAARLLGDPSADEQPNRRIALIGLRGAGKTTLGQALAESLGFPFIELSREIERLAGCDTGEIQALYGQNAYRRYERRALEETLSAHGQSVIATPGGLVTDAGSFNLLLGRCITVWLKADPEDHMRRVIAQGDTRPVAASREAMQDLRNILEGRSAFYSKAAIHIETSGQTLAQTQEALLQALQEPLNLSQAAPRAAQPKSEFSQNMN